MFTRSNSSTAGRTRGVFTQPNLNTCRVETVAARIRTGRRLLEILQTYDTRSSNGVASRTFGTRHVCDYCLDDILTTTNGSGNFCPSDTTSGKIRLESTDIKMMVCLFRMVVTKIIRPDRIDTGSYRYRTDRRGHTPLHPRPYVYMMDSSHMNMSLQSNRCPCPSHPVDCSLCILMLTALE